MHLTRRRMIRPSPIALAFQALFFAATSSFALAQSWRSDVQHAEGPGFRVGDLEVHPGVGVEGGYDSNVFYSDKNLVDSFVLRVTPHLDLSTLSAQRLQEGPSGKGSGALPKVAFRAGLSGSYYHYFSANNLSNMDANGDLRVLLFPKRRFSGTIFNRFNRSIRPFSEQGAANNNYARNRNEAGAIFEAASPGNVLRGSLGYSFLFDLFESSTFKYLNTLDNRIQADASWRFLPSTSLIYDLQLDVQDFTDPNSPGAFAANADTRRFRSRLGLNGAITPTFSAVAMVGYGGSFVSSNILSEYDDAVALAELRWRPKASTNLTVGYDRDYFTSYVGSYYRRDRGFAQYQMMFAGVVNLGLEFWAGRLAYGRVIGANGAPISDDGTTKRDDTMISGTLFAEYRIFNWLAVNGTFMYLGDFSDFAFSSGASVAPDPANYQKLQGWLGVRGYY